MTNQEKIIRSLLAGFNVGFKMPYFFFKDIPNWYFFLVLVGYYFE